MNSQAIPAYTCAKCQRPLVVTLETHRPFGNYYCSDACLDAWVNAEVKGNSWARLVDNPDYGIIITRQQRPNLPTFKIRPIEPRDLTFKQRLAFLFPRLRKYFPLTTL